MAEASNIRGQLAGASSIRALGSVVGVTGLTLRIRLPSVRIGDLVTVRRRGEPLLAEVVGFRSGDAIALPLGDVTGVGADDEVEATGGQLRVPVGEALLGRILDGFGRPLDGRALPQGLEHWEVDRAAPPALSRKGVERAFPTGVRTVDALLTMGVGQRVGLFAGSGVGKSTLLGAMARGCAADVVVVALVGERGREVSEFIQASLAEALKRSVVIVATSDAPAMQRVRAAQTATTVAEYFRERDQSVLLLVDSVTRYARALREVGLAAGEPPTRRGYPPSVFAALPRLLERTGQSASGAVTSVYTVLVEGEDFEEPIADEVRGILDGHIVLSREVAARGWYPAIDVSRSLSRVMSQCVADAHKHAASQLRKRLAAYEAKRSLIELGAYEKGGDPLVDDAVRLFDPIQQLLLQQPGELSDYEATIAQLKALTFGARR